VKRTQGNIVNKKLMKIGILTQPLLSNYGGILQAYALQKTLKKLGHEARVIDIHYKKNWFWDAFKSAGKILLNNLLFRTFDNHFVLYPNQKEFNEIYKNNLVFIGKHFDKTKRLNCVKHYRDIAEYGFKCIVVGSDQVWRPEYSPAMPNYFLDFLVGNMSIKKIAYAASFGVDYWKFNERETKTYSKLVQDFDAISVREDAAVLLSKQNFNVDSSLVLDPTLLLTTEDYENLIESEDCSIHQSYLFSYVLDGAPEKKAIISKLSSELTLDINSIDMKLKYKSINKIDVNKSAVPSIGNWINGFKNADYVVTDSFHGMVFSILFNKPFIVIGNIDRGMSRFTSLLKLLQLDSRLVFSLEQLTTDKINESIDYLVVNEIITREKKKSLNFLAVALA
jgi:hypothetical protein